MYKTCYQIYKLVIEYIFQSKLFFFYILILSRSDICFYIKKNNIWSINCDISAQAILPVNVVFGQLIFRHWIFIFHFISGQNNPPTGLNLSNFILTQLHHINRDMTFRRMQFRNFRELYTFYVM